ncbi:BMP family lipoprotein [Nonomuraea soli]|uniref:Basic membrane protein A n=1 Tax=Nonomuraea soli TaxID=1032476 RepID=A0A7W0CK53_9ACTN|nr:BMP family ABC transporter substrate-binding protein [Nonomuraea soli]MBA2892430.1 basic membrane protein A [Nonomuraea soli]
MRSITRLLAVAALMTAAACGSSDSGGSSNSGGGGATGGSSSMKVGLAYDIGGRGDQSFNDSAAAGLDKAKKDFGLAETRELEAASGETDAQKEERLRLLADAGYDPIIAVGFAYATSLKKVAGEFPDVNFAIVDDASVTASNISNLVFADEQGSFLVGAAAGLKTTKNNVGFVGGVQVPLIKKFEVGYAQGVKHVKPDTKVQTKYLTQPPDFSGFADPAKGKTAAEGMYDAGADIVYQAAGGSGAGVFEAAKAANAWAIGVDSDQALTASADVRDRILTSMVKKVDVAVYDFIGSNVNGKVQTGTVMYDLAKNGVDYATTGGHVDDIKAQLDELKQQIIDGEIKVAAS